jgi:hypothetical protein
MIPVANRDEDYGGRVFSCRDPEGHLWNIGIPWTAPAQWKAQRHARRKPKPDRNPLST